MVHKLIEFIKNQIPNREIKDILLVGSRAGGWHKNGSDYDLRIIMNDDELPFQRGIPEKFHGKRVGMRSYPKDYNPHTHYYKGKYKLPAYSLMTNTFYKGDEDDIVRFLKDRGVYGEDTAQRLEKIHSYLREKPSEFNYDGDWINLYP